MNTNRKVFGNSSTTPGAELRGILSGDFNHLSSSLRRFEAKCIEEPEPSCISHLSGEIVIGTIPKVHALDTDSIVCPNKQVGNLKMKIPSLVSNFLMGSGNKDSSLVSTIGPLFTSREPSLPHCQSLFRLLKMMWVVNLGTIGGSKEGLKSYIYTHSFASLREWSFRNIFTREDCKPLAGGSSTDGDGLNVSFYRARESKFEGAQIGDGKIFAFELPAGLFQGKRVIAIPALKPWKARLFTVLNSSKEALKGSVQTLKDILEHLRAYFPVFREGSFKLRELFNLDRLRNGVMVLPVDSDTLLKGGIVEVTAKVKPMVSLLDSLGIRLNAILKGLLHLPCTMLNLAQSRKRGKRAFIPKGEVFSPAIL